MKRFATLISAAMLAASAGNAQVLMQENFEGVTLPALPVGWVQTTAATTGWKTNAGVITSNNGAWTLDAHTKYAVIDDWNSNENNNPSQLASPVFSTVGQAHVYLDYSYYFVGAGYNSGTFAGQREVAYVKASMDGGATWNIIDTVKGMASKWQSKKVSLAAYENKATVQIAFWYADNGAGQLPGIAVDDIKVYIPAANDASISAVTPVIGSPKGYDLAGGAITLGGTAVNNGYNNITSFTVMYQQGANAPVSNTVTGVNIAPFASADFTCSNNFTLPANVTEYPIKMWIVLPGDADNTNDSMSTAVNTVAFKPNKKILFEEGTGAWCGFCPRGAVYMDSIEHTYPNNVTLVAVHNNDPMAVLAYDAFVSAKIGGYPNVLVDRKDVVDPSDMFDVYNEQKNNFGFADITMTDMGANNFDLSVKVSVKPALNLSGDYRLAMVLTENNVNNSLATYNQHNYYYGGNYGPLIGAGHNWVTEGTPKSYGSDILGENMYYHFVGRAIIPSPTGAAGSLPATMTANTTYDYTFNTTVAQPFNRGNMHIVVLMLRNSDGAVLNSANMVMPLGISSLAAGVQHLGIYPNPANNAAHIAFNLTERSKVSVQVINALGQVVNTIGAQQYEQGAQKIDLNTANLAAGVYTVKVQTEKGALTQQLSIAK